MNLRVLGCSGGIGAGLRTTSLLVDNDILIDAGSGVGELTYDEMKSLRHIFISHSHLDHVAFIPLLVDSIFEHIVEPITVHAQPATLEALQKHIFNWVIWPDFSQLPTPERPVLRFEAMNPGEVRDIDGRSIEMIAVSHSVPAAGYWVKGSEGAFAFSGDTTSNDNFWEVLNAKPRLDLLIVEVAFRNAQHRLATLAGHYCPQFLASDLAKLRHRPQIYLSHLKPGDENSIVAECRQIINGGNIKPLVGGEVFQL